jgi:pyroglutamyl-peptidase
VTGGPHEQHEQVDEPVVLVTVFGPFPGQPENPTERIADALAGDDHVVSHVLDVSYARAVQQIDELLRMVRPAAAVGFGVVGDARGVRLEEAARNRDGATIPDVDGSLGVDGPIDGGPATVPTRLPLPQIADALVGAGIPVEPSDDAGRYVCNRVFRHLVTHPALAGRPAGFIHVPDPRRDGSLDVETIALAGRIVVDAVAAAVRGDI